jgi:hypothetical protein
LTLPLTKEMCAGMYDYIRTTPPFRNWNLPEAEEVVFRVTRDPGRKGHYRRDRYGRREIAVSIASIGYTGSLAEVMAHEMIHLHEDMVGILYKSNAEHTRFFRRNAEIVCKFHGFDPRLFY